MLSGDGGDVDGIVCVCIWSWLTRSEYGVDAKPVRLRANQNEFIK